MPDADGAPWLRFGNHFPITPGIHFTAIDSTFPPGIGNYVIVQVVTRTVNEYAGNGTLQKSIVNTTDLDNCYVGNDNDSPGYELYDIYGEVDETFTATTYWLWSSGLPKSIPVPLGQVDWGWVGSAIQMNNAWTGGGYIVNPTFYFAFSENQPYKSYPYWNSTATNTPPITCAPPPP